ncbi:MAG: hypothetical protein K2J89_03315 [Clostridia bacterium]|nr:hypothetical protein [Clostridia bacterium]
MKNRITLLTIILLIALMTILPVACSGDVDKEGYMTLVVKNGEDIKEYSVDLTELSSDTSQSGLMVILDHLQEKGELTYSAQDSAYGAYLTAVNDISEGNGVYITLYTDVESDIDVSEDATTLAYKEKTLTSSGVGLSLMNVKSGCTIVITTFSYNG